jgi:hypothetical protein
MFNDWEIIIRSAGENKLYYFADILCRHGDKDGGARGKFRNYKYLCGHFHKFVSFRRSVQIGCGAKLGPKFVGNELNSWQSQLAVLTKYKDVGAVSVKIILHDKERDFSRFAYRGVIYEVPFYK